jgi:hypothetical protein
MAGMGELPVEDIQLALHRARTDIEQIGQFLRDQMGIVGQGGEDLLLSGY